MDAEEEAEAGAVEAAPPREVEEFEAEEGRAEVREAASAWGGCGWAEGAARWALGAAAAAEGAAAAASGDEDGGGGCDWLDVSSLLLWLDCIDGGAAAEANFLRFESEECSDWRSFCHTSTEAKQRREHTQGKVSPAAGCCKNQPPLCASLSHIPLLACLHLHCSICVCGMTLLMSLRWCWMACCSCTSVE